MTDLYDFCEAWIHGYVDEHEFIADGEKVDATIEALHDHLCKSVEGFMQDVGPGAEWDMEAKS